MSDEGFPVRSTPVRLAAGLARASSVVVLTFIAVGLAVGPVIWVLGSLHGDEVQVDGGTIRVAGQVVLAGVLARIATDRSRRGSPARSGPS